MPIYAYKCASCGHAKDVLQKISDEPLSVCPACGAATFNKQLTAAGFQLKGSGWYATDFRGSGSAPAANADKADKADKTDTAKPADAPKTDSAAKPADGGSTPPKNDTPTASAGGRGCH
jgi:putative FmdB family regulatory protein